MMKVTIISVYSSVTYMENKTTGSRRCGRVGLRIVVCLRPRKKIARDRVFRSRGPTAQLIPSL